MTEEGKKLLIDMEGLTTNVYRDLAGNPTIGVGHKLTADELTSGFLRIAEDLVNWHDGISQEQAMILLDQDLSAREQPLRQLILVTLSPHQWDAVLILVFNIGINAFANSTLLRKLNMHDFSAVEDQWRRWNKVHIGKEVEISAGLSTRRDRELQLWAST